MTTLSGSEQVPLAQPVLIWAPAIEGAVVLTRRGGDLELSIGRDISIGYLAHTDEVCASLSAGVVHLSPAHQRGVGGARVLRSLAGLNIESLSHCAYAGSARATQWK